MNLQVLDVTDVITIEQIRHKGQIVITTKQLAESYEANEQQIQQNFNNHKGNFKQGKHYYLLQGLELKEFKSQFDDIEEALGISKFTSQLYLWTHKGASRHCKILDTDKAWEQFDSLEENYFEGNTSKPMCIEDIIIHQMQQMKNMKQQLNQVNNNILRANKLAVEAKEEAQAIKEVVSLDTTSWRSETQTLIARMARNQGDLGLIKDFRNESYELLNKRFGVNLETRLTNKRRRMAEEGVSKSKRDKLNNLDVIAEDKKLIEGYVAIVKDMAIRHGI